ncbi:MAG: response regulator [Candidatus Eisenbacteria sp.]|nr:response regulator [Candidatus Eisenbacteria bacterium]
MKRRILFVDDDSRVLNGVRRMLRDVSGLWELEYATSAAEAMDLLGKKPFDAAVLDVMMPGKNGLDLLADMKARPELSDIEVVVLTGLEDQDLKRRALNLGAVDLLNKPVAQEDLVARLSNALRVKSSRDELLQQNLLLEQQLLQSQKMEMVGTLAAGVAHDINNILAIILGSSDLLACYLDTNDKAREKVQTIQKSCDHARTLVRQVVALSQGETGERAACDLGKIVDDCIGLLRASAPRGVEVRWSDSETTGRLVEADAGQIRQVVMNLGVNALQAVSRGGAVEISLGDIEPEGDAIPGGGTVRPGPCVELRVADSGRGIDPQIMERIFKPLYTTRGLEGGTGLGLSIVRRIVRDHGGEVAVESSLGVGTVFSVCLPACGAGETAEERPAPASRPVDEDGVSAPPAALARANNELAARVEQQAAELARLNGQLRRVTLEQEKAEETPRPDIAESRAREHQIVQSQKLESIGQLAAGIAHEINTPTQYVGDNVRFLDEAFRDLETLLAKGDQLVKAVKAGEKSEGLIQEMESLAEDADVEYLTEEIPRAISQALEGIDRVAHIVRAMKEFSHPGTDGHVPTDVNKAIESTATVARNEWKYVADMKMELDKSLPLVPCLPGEFNQVILNLIINAAHAIAGSAESGASEKGRITLSTTLVGNEAEIRISDTGTGIPEEIRSRVFDPFFTTKEVGKGTGQGLAVCRSVIVQKHGGTLQFETETGRGTTFVIRLPLGGKTEQVKAEQREETNLVRG